LDDDEEDDDMGIDDDWGASATADMLWCKFRCRDDDDDDK
jgi:hypothetical protein